jgi:hypothetical protein
MALPRSGLLFPRFTMGLSVTGIRSRASAEEVTVQLQALLCLMRLIGETRTDAFSLGILTTALQKIPLARVLL